jgi:hypothetical protein
MFRFPLFRTIRTATRTLPSRRSGPGCRPKFDTLEDRSVPAHVYTIGSPGVPDLVTAISLANADAANTTPTNPDVIKFPVGYTPVQLEGMVQNAGNLEIDGDLTLDDFATLTNLGTLHVTGNLSLGHEGSVDGDKSLLNNGLTSTASAKLTVDGSLSLGDDSNLDNFGTSSISVGGELSFGGGSTLNNGGASLDLSNADAAVSLTANSLIMGTDTLVYNQGVSSISVTTNFTMGDASSQYFGGLTDSASASLSVGGNFSIGEGAIVGTYGTSNINVTGDFTLGSDALLENGQSTTDAATITVGGNLTLGTPSDGAFLSGDVTNTGNSTIKVTNNFTVYGDQGSFVENGSTDTDAAVMSIGGQFSMGANSQFLEMGTQSFRTKDFVLGPGSSFSDSSAHSAMIVSGNFDAGASSATDVIAGLFLAEPGSTVWTNTATWDVESTGVLDIDGASIVVEGHLIVDGIVDPPNMTVQGSGSVSVDAGGQLTVGSLVVADSATVDVAPASGSAAAGTVTVTGSLAVTGTAVVDVSGTLTAGSFSQDNPGQLVQETGSSVVLDMSPPSLLTQTITFTPPPVSYSTGSTTVSLVATASSGLPVTFSFVGNASGASIVDSTLTIPAGTAGGTVIEVQADQSGSDTYDPAAANDQFITISPAVQSIAFNAPAPVSYSTGSTTLSLAATASSNLAVSYSIVGVSHGASITGNTLTIPGGTPGGTVIKIEADQAGNGNYNAAAPKDQSITISPAVQSITFSTLPPITTSSPSFTLTAMASSGLPVTYSATGNVTLTQSGNVWTVQPTGTGTITITASQTGNGNYLAATPVMQSFTISATGATVTVPSGQLYTFTDPNGNQVSIEATGGATTTLYLQTVSGTRKQLTSMAVAGATTATNLTISASGGTTINNLTIAGSAIHDINLGSVNVNGFSSSVPMHNLVAGSLQGSIQLTGGGHNVAVGSIGTASGTAAATLSGGFNNVVFGLVLSGSSFTLVGAAHDVVFGDVASGATLSLGTSAQTAALNGFVGGIISGSLLVYDTFQTGVVLSISGHVYLKSIGGSFITASWPAGNWVGADLSLAGGGDILLGTIGDKSKVIAL